MLNLFIRLKKELLELYQRLESQVLESNSFNILKERYQSLSILNQKLIKIFLMVLFLVIVLYFPVYYISSSSVSWFDLKKKYKLSIELLKVREKSSFSNMKSTKKLLKNRINDIVQKYSTENIQIKERSKKDSKFDFVEQVTFEIDVPYLNIRQAIQLGTELESISQIRLKELSFKENTKYKNRYDVYYDLSGFVISEKVQSKPKRRKRRRKQRTKQKDSVKDIKNKEKSRQNLEKEENSSKKEENSSKKERKNQKPSKRIQKKSIEKTKKEEKIIENEGRTRFRKGKEKKEILIEDIEENQEPLLKLDSAILERKRQREIKNRIKNK